MVSLGGTSIYLILPEKTSRYSTKIIRCTLPLHNRNIRCSVHRQKLSWSGRSIYCRFWLSSWPCDSSGYLGNRPDTHRTASDWWQLAYSLYLCRTAFQKMICLKTTNDNNQTEKKRCQDFILAWINLTWSLKAKENLIKSQLFYQPNKEWYTFKGKKVQNREIG